MSKSIRLAQVLFLLVFSLSSCVYDCGYDSGDSAGSCRSLASSLRKTQIAGFGSCSSATNSRKIEIVCAADSGTNGTCTSRSDGSAYVAVFVPNNSQGNFRDSNYRDGTGSDIIGDCNSLWNAMISPNGTGPADIAGVYYGSPDSGDYVTCTDSAGCRATSNNCLSGWDYVSGGPTGVTASLANGSYLACLFIDSPWANGVAAQGVPPFANLPAGLIATSTPYTFTGINLKSPTTTAVKFDTWVDYANATDECSVITNSRKIRISCAKTSGSTSACTSRSDRSSYYVVIVPDTGGGKFVDSNYSTLLGNGAITNCSTLWSAMTGPIGSRPTDVKAFYEANPGADDFVSCDDTNGCSVTSQSCFNGWSASSQGPSGDKATIANGTYLACAFIDSPHSDGSPATGMPPTSGAGLVATSAANAFTTVTFTSPGQNPLTLSTWVDY